MSKIDRRSLLAALGAAPLAGGLLAQAQTQTQTDTSSPLARFKNVSSRERTQQKYFPNLVLTTHEGKKVKFYDDLVKDKIVIFNMMYAKCEGICMPITHNLLKVQKLLGKRVGKDIFMYSFTLKPKEDTVKVLNQYARMHKVKPGWYFITGSVDDMETLRRKLGYVDPDPEVDKDKSNHIGVIKYGNEPIERWGGCPGLSSPEWIVETLSWLDTPKDMKKVSAGVSAGKGGL